jgi:hypothetical protein
LHNIAAIAAPLVVPVRAASAQPAGNAQYQRPASWFGVIGKLYFHFKPATSNSIWLLRRKTSLRNKLFSAPRMTTWKVGKAVGSVKNQGPELIEQAR